MHDLFFTYSFRGLRPAVLTLWALLGISGCSTLKGNGDTQIDTWLQTQVIPDIKEKLTTLPKFKGQPVMVVGMDEGNLSLANNALIKSLQNQTISALLTSPEILLANPGNHTNTLHTDLNQLKCGLYQDADVFIGIDTEQDPVAGKLRVTIKAYDAHEKLQYLSGISYEFEDSLDEKYLSALKLDSEDASIKGSRRFPFDQSEADQLADNLSHQLACLLSQSAKDNVVIYSVVSDADSTYMKTTAALVANALTNYKQISLTDDKSAANTLLSLTSHSLGQKQRLSIVSADIATQDNILIGGASAKAYVRTDILNSLAVAPKKEPAYAFSNVNLLMPASLEGCASNTPWDQGETKIAEGAGLASDQCFAIEASVNQPSNLFVVYQTPHKGLQLMLPSQCSLFADVPSAVDAYGIMRFPTIDGKVKVIDLGKRKGTESFYVIATQTSTAKTLVEEKLKTLTDFCKGTDVVPNTQSDTAQNALSLRTSSDIESWLKAETEKHTGQLIWQKRSFRHE